MGSASLGAVLRVCSWVHFQFSLCFPSVDTGDELASCSCCRAFPIMVDNAPKSALPPLSCFSLDILPEKQTQNKQHTERSCETPVLPLITKIKDNCTFFEAWGWTPSSQATGFCEYPSPPAMPVSPLAAVVGRITMGI